jgi:CRISPR-associated protein Cpf1
MFKFVFLKFLPMTTFKNISDFTNQYQLSKTLRFELKPVGKTKEFIEKKGLITQDEQRAESYKKVKKIIDEYHKSFIELALQNLKLEGLGELAKLYYKLQKDDDDKKEIGLLQDNLRKTIAKAFSKNTNTEVDAIFKNLFLKELIKDDLVGWVKTEEEKKLVTDFKNFTTYFTGFHENRKNMYKDEAISTAIAFRLIHENLPKFLDNLNVFQKLLQSEIDITSINSELESVIQGIPIDEVFSLDYFSQTLTQSGIELYNIILGGRSEEGKKKIKGLNEYINLYNQKQEKNKRIPKFKPLFKQILSDRTSSSFVLEDFENDNELLENIEQFYTNELLHFESDGQTQNIFKLIEQLFQNTQTFDASKVYLRNDTSLTNLSQRIFGEWAIIPNALAQFHDRNLPMSTREKVDKYEERKNKWLKQDFSIAAIENALAVYENETAREIFQPGIIFSHFTSQLNDKKEHITQHVYSEYDKVKSLLNTAYPDDKNLSADKENVSKIKSFLDAIMDLIHFIKPLYLKDVTIDKDETFYSFYTPLYEQLDKTIPVYNKVRNYLTRKPYSTEKVKLNFESSYLLSGWSQDYETKAGLLFLKDGIYYLGINEKKLKDDEKKKLFVNPELETGERIILDFQKPDNKNIPRLFIRSKGDSFAPAVTKYNLPIQSVIQIYDSGKFKTDYRKINENDYLQSLHKLIDYFKLGFTKHESYKHYDFIWKNTNEYLDIAQFYNDVETSCYQVKFEKNNWEALNNLVDEGKLYLFQIYNKDFSPYSKGTPNMHTLYWKMLFDPKNIENVVYKLNGQAEVFYRKSSIKMEETAIHKAGELINNKNPDNDKKQSRFAYDIVKNKRFTLDKFQFHVPITMNFKSEGNERINNDVLSFLKNNPDINIIGLDRGERHLIYLTLINQQGDILLQESLNSIVNEQQKVDYHKLLDMKEGGRDEARKNWGTIENIKELKEGYVSQVVHKIAKLMVEHNAIVVMEDLNFGFKRGRQKVEKQVYQKFEKMLIDKLNYLVFKNEAPENKGGVLNALQLTNKFESFQKLGKQSGFVFYVPASLTSKICPATGFVNMLNTKYESITKSQDFFSRFDSIHYNPTKDYFEFAFDYNNFHLKAEGTKTNWMVCTHGDTRYRYNPQTKQSEEVNITAELKRLFDKFKMDYQQGDNLQKLIVEHQDKALHAKLLHLLGLTLSLRHAKSGTDIDFILSPVANQDGAFFDSRLALASQPSDADANGAYHIALKGKWILEQINKADDFKKLNLAISNKEWLNFAQAKVNQYEKERI